MSNKDPRILSLRTLRKASSLSAKASKKSGRFFDRVESKTTRIIVNKAGAPDGRHSAAIDDVFYSTYPQMYPLHPALPVIGQKPSVTVFAFLDPRGFYGGIATLLITAGTLANELGYDLRIAQTTGYSKENDVLAFLESNGVSISEDRLTILNVSDRNPHKFAYLPLHPDDVIMVSAWWDAHIAAQLPLKRKFLYLIQDYEPIFYNNSDAQMYADQTYYSEKFIPLCNTEILYKYFVNKGYKYITDNATWFEPAPAPKTDIPAASAKKDTKKLFMYGRPNVHRNLFFSTIRAIDLAFQDERLRDQSWELYCAGSADVPSVRLHSGDTIKNLGKMDLAEYYAWAQTIDVAVSPMLAPHPNYPTLELASMGAMVVSTKWETKQDLTSYSPNILMADPTIESMAENIIKAALTSDDQRQANAKKNNITGSWTEALAQPMGKIAQNYRKGN